MTSKKDPTSVTSIVIFGLCLVTAAIHFFQNDPVLKLNALGYIALGSIILFNISSLAQVKQNAHQMLSAYAFVTIILYFVVYQEAGFENTIGMVAKVTELLIIATCSLNLFKRRKGTVRNRFRSRPMWMLHL